MTVSQSSEALRRPAGLLYIVFPVLALVSLVLGYLGLDQFLASKSDYGHRIVDLVYYDLQLFVLGSDPLQTAGPYPIALDLARFTAPAVSVYAVIEAIRLLLSVELSRLRARRSRGHVIVCGDSEFADALTRTLRTEGKGVIEVRAEADEFVTRGEPIRIVGDARDPEVLRSAGIDHAVAVYACADESATNIAVAMTVNRTVARTGPGIFTYGLISDPDFCVTMQALFLGNPINERVHTDFFNSDHIAARRLFREHDWQSDAVARRGPPHLVVAGTDNFARAVAVEAVRGWRVVTPHLVAGAERLELTMIGPDAAAVVRELQDRFPFLGEWCRFAALDGDLLSLIQRGQLSTPPGHAFITDADEELTLKTATTVEHHWRGRTPITVRLDGALIGMSSVADRLTGFPSAMRAFGVVGAAADPGLIRDDLTERIARVLHDHYVRGRQSRESRATGRAMTAWDDLSPQLQHANRLQAEDIGRKLKDIGYVIMPRHMHQRPVELAPTEEDRLAMMEHDRWRREQERQGWRYAPVFDEHHRLHPGLVPWSGLTHEMRERNYDPVRALPVILGDAGFQMVQA